MEKRSSGWCSGAAFSAIELLIGQSLNKYETADKGQTEDGWEGGGVEDRVWAGGDGWEMDGWTDGRMALEGKGGRKGRVEEEAAQSHSDQRSLRVC